VRFLSNAQGTCRCTHAWYRVPPDTLSVRQAVRPVSIYRLIHHLSIPHCQIFWPLCENESSLPSTPREIQREVSERLGVGFDHVMLNRYQDGSVHIGKHRDTRDNQVRITTRRTTEGLEPEIDAPWNGIGYCFSFTGRQENIRHAPSCLKGRAEDSGCRGEAMGIGQW
jgi:hypothetical protein